MRGTVRWRNGAWRIQVYAGRVAGRERRIQRTVRAPNTRRGRARAEAALAHLLDDVDVGRVRLDDDPTVDDVVERWITHRAPDWSPKTLRDKRGLVARYVTPELGSRHLSRLRGHDLADLYARLRRDGGHGRPLAASTVAQVHKTLHAAFAEAVRWGLIAVNPADQVRAPTVPPPRPAPPSAEQVAVALSRLDGPFAVFVRLAASTGARRGQLCALRWADVDVERGSVTFAAAVVDGGPGIGPVVRSTKTGAAWQVALDADTVAAVAAHRRRMAARALSVGVDLPDDRGVFSDDPASRIPWRPESVSGRWRRTRARIGLDGVPLKDLRHLVATELLAAGVDVRTVAGRLGHATPTVTLSTYAAFVPAADRVAAERMGRLLAGVGPGDDDPGDRPEGGAEGGPQGPSVDVLHRQDRA